MNGKYQVGSGRVVTVAHDSPFINDSISQPNAKSNTSGNNSSDRRSFRHSLMKNICQLLKAVICGRLKGWLTNRQNEKTAVFDTVEVNDSVGSTAVTPTLTRRNGVYTAVYNSISQPDAKSNSSDENSIRY